MKYLALAPTVFLAALLPAAAPARASSPAQGRGCQPDWLPTGSGLLGISSFFSANALALFDDGSGPALFVGGVLNTEELFFHIARWDGTDWSLLGVGVDGDVYDMQVFDDGSGEALYVCGAFSTAGGATEYYVARWNGSSWSSLAGGFPDVNNAGILHVFDDGGGPRLYAASYDAVDEVWIDRWDGASWEALTTTGMHDPVFVLEVLPGGQAFGPALYAGGRFTNSPAGDSHLARWGCDVLPPSIDCPPFALAFDSGAPGEFVTFTVSAEDDLDPAPTVVCTPPSGSFFPRGTTLVQCKATDASGNESTCGFPVVVQIKALRR